MNVNLISTPFTIAWGNELRWRNAGCGSVWILILSKGSLLFPQPFFMNHSIQVQVTVGIPPSSPSPRHSPKKGILTVGNKPKALCITITHRRCVWGLRKKNLEAPLASDFFRWNMLTYFFLLGFVKVKPMYFSVEMVARIFESTKD